MKPLFTVEKIFICFIRFFKRYPLQPGVSFYYLKEFYTCYRKIHYYPNIINKCKLIQIQCLKDNVLDSCLLLG